MSTDETRIREFAYQIWLSEGQPEDQQARHWDMARKLAEAEALAPSKPSTAKAKPKAAVTTTKSTAKPATPAIAQPTAQPLAPKKPRAPRKPAAT